MRFVPIWYNIFLLSTWLGYSLSQWSDQAMKRIRRTTEYESLDIHRSKSDCRNKLKKGQWIRRLYRSTVKREMVSGSVLWCYICIKHYFQHHTLPKCGRHSCTFQHEAGHGAEVREHFHLNCKHDLRHHNSQATNTSQQTTNFVRHICIGNVYQCLKCQC